jgi:hypothetical protein
MDHAQASSSGALVYTPNLDEPNSDEPNLDKPDLDEPDLDDDFSAETRDKMIDKKLLKDVGIELEGLELKSGGPSSHSNNKSPSQSKCRCSRDVT